MFFCPNCNNSLDLTKLASQTSSNNKDDISQTSESSHAQVAGGKSNYDELINKILSNDSIDGVLNPNEFVLDELLVNSKYTKFSREQKELIYNTIQDLLPLDHKDKKLSESTKQYTTHKIHYICNNCGFTKQVEPKSKIFSRESESMTKTFNTTSIIDMKHSNILPLTRKYTCVNSSCPSHKDGTKREAMRIRLINSFDIRYLCKACDTVF